MTLTNITAPRRASLAGVVAVLFALALGMAPSARASEPSQISGKVTDVGTEAALSGVEVCAYARDGGEAHKCTSTDSSGEYTVPGLTAGSYTVEFSAVNLGYVTQFYDDQTSYVDATPVTAQAGATTQEINAKLVPGGSIAGKVIDATTQAPIEDVLVCAFEGEAEPSGVRFYQLKWGIRDLRTTERRWIQGRIRRVWAVLGISTAVLRQQVLTLRSSAGSGHRVPAPPPGSTPRCSRYRRRLRSTKSCPKYPARPRSVPR